MILTYYRIVCNICGKPSEMCDTEEDVIDIAVNVDGFKRVDVENGSTWDYCSKCYSKKDN